MSTYRSFGDEVGDGSKLAGVRVDERLVPSPSRLIADLEDVGQDDRAIVLGQVLKRGLREVVLVESAVELLLSGGDRVLDGDDGGGGGDLGGLDKRGAEGGDLVGLVDGDVRNCVRDRDAVECLLDVDVASGVALEGRAEVDGIGVDAVARLHECDSSILVRRVGTLRQRVVNALSESLLVSRR